MLAQSRMEARVCSARSRVCVREASALSSPMPGFEAQQRDKEPAPWEAHGFPYFVEQEEKCSESRHKQIAKAQKLVWAPEMERCPASLREGWFLNDIYTSCIFYIFCNVFFTVRQIKD